MRSLNESGRVAGTPISAGLRHLGLKPKREKIACISGDGIGPEIVDAARLVLDATDVQFDWIEVLAGEDAFARYKDAVPRETLDAIRECGVALKAPITNPGGSNYLSPNIGLRQELGLYVNVRVGRSFPGARAIRGDMNVVVVRELTEDIYTGPQRMIGADGAIATKFVTRQATARASRFAFEWALATGRHKVTVAHKETILRTTDGLFLEAAREVSRDYPMVEFGEELVDALVARLVRSPAQFDIILAGNQYGDILSDLVAAMAGGLGLGAGAYFGDDAAIFEPVHGSAPKYAGKNVANPTGMILSAAMLLEHIGQKEAAAAVSKAVEAVYAKGRDLTFDQGGAASTMEYAEAVAKEIR